MGRHVCMCIHAVCACVFVCNLSLVYEIVLEIMWYYKQIFLMYFAFSAVKWLLIHTEYKTKHVEIIWSLKTHDLNTAKIQGGLGKL